MGCCVWWLLLLSMSNVRCVLNYTFSMSRVLQLDCDQSSGKRMHLSWCKFDCFYMFKLFYCCFSPVKLSWRCSLMWQCFAFTVGPSLEELCKGPQVKLISPKDRNGKLVLFRQYITSKLLDAIPQRFSLDVCFFGVLKFDVWNVQKHVSECCHTDQACDMKVASG